MAKTANKTPDLALLQEFLNQPPEEVVSRLRETLISRDSIKGIFFSDKAPEYRRMLEEARKNAPDTFNTLTTQVETQCSINTQPNTDQKLK